MSTQQDTSIALNPLCLAFENQTVRIGIDNRPSWIAVDVCRVLGLKNVSKALQRLYDSEKGLTFCYTPGGVQQLLVVYESGLYKLIARSSKPAALRFQDWIFQEVLPCIGQHGTYPAPRPAPVKTCPVVAVGNDPYTKRTRDAGVIRRALPRGYWCVLLEGSLLLAEAQTLFADIGLPVSDLDLMDGSMGTAYSKYRTGKAWAGKSEHFEYTFPCGDPRGRVFPLCYPLSELPHFREWSTDVYLSTKFPNYVLNKPQYKDKLHEYPKLGPAMAALRALALPAART